MFEGIVFDAILAFNGSFCVAGDQVVAKCPIPKEDVEKIIENAKRMERPVSIATAEKIIFTLFNFIISLPPNQYILFLIIIILQFQRIKYLFNAFIYHYSALLTDCKNSIFCLLYILCFLSLSFALYLS